MSSTQDRYDHVNSGHPQPYMPPPSKSRHAWPGSLNGTHARPFLELLRLARIGCEAGPGGSSTLSLLMDQLQISSDAGQYISSEEMLYHVTITRDDMTRDEQRKVNLPRSTSTSEALLKVRADTLLLEDESWAAAMNLWKAITKIYATYTAEDESTRVLATATNKSNIQEDFVLPHIAAINQGSTAASVEGSSPKSRLTFAQPTSDVGHAYAALFGEAFDSQDSDPAAFDTSSTYSIQDFLQDLSSTMAGPSTQSAIAFGLPNTGTGVATTQPLYSAHPPRGCWPFSIVLVEIFRVKKVILVTRLFPLLKSAPKDYNTVACLLLYIMLQDDNTQKGRSVCYTMLSDVTPDVAFKLSTDSQGQLVIELIDPDHPYNFTRKPKQGWDFKDKRFQPLHLL
ncbi:hypothetical protein CF319_g7295 [Tilletia indica]|uniref:Uncharacterized protein n=1 Tax=Tilletia indica TaxID=43049 RepID=A0A177T5D6_9BASI|nr:hypothetical protein CF319_g7295 [Tilletia indica]KAE8230710.1 hypothetical protein CF326_g4280 [Tilletia indica]KAE8244700.1 hypothetical protein A4X13_0g6353 [Tilletia indica]